MTPPRLAFVDQTGKLGGAELSLLDLVTRYGGDNTVILFEDGPFATALQSHEVPVVVCPIGSSANRIRKDSRSIEALLSLKESTAHALRLRKLLTSYDVLYTNTSKAAILGALANAGSRRPMIHHLRDLITADHFSGLNRRLLVQTLNRRVRKVIANSQATADAYVEAGGRGEKVVVIPNGIDFEPFERAYAQRDQLRSQLRSEIGIAEATPVAALVGRLAEWKGQHVALQALAELPDLHLLLVGDALFGEEEYKQHLHDLARSLGVVERVHFLGFRPNVAELMQGVDLVLHTSTAPEPFGRVIVEAMLSRIPVIATRGGGAAEIVNHGETGLLVEMGSASSLASAIREALQDADRAQGMVDKAYHVALERYDIDRVVKQVEAVIREVAGVA